MDNLEKLTLQVKAQIPNLDDKLLSRVTQSRKTNKAWLAIPTAASMALVLALSLSNGQTQRKAIFNFPKSKNQVVTGISAVPAIPVGIKFTASDQLGSQPGEAEVWKVNAVNDLDLRIRELAKIISPSKPISVDYSSTTINEGQSYVYLVTADTGNWNYQNFSHGTTVDGVCLDTKKTGNCVISQKTMGADYYLSSAVKIFNAGGWTGPTSDIQLTSENDWETATVSHLVAGKPSPIGWRITWFPDGVISSSSGFLSTIDPQGIFAIISPKDSVARADNYQQWTYADANFNEIWAPPVSSGRATVTKADLVLGYYGEFLVPSYRLTGNSGSWYRQVNALETSDK